jgi:protein-ribulosamine 3-kinase
VPVGGGSISPAARLELDDGRRFFIKWAAGEGTPARLFTEEARSLAALGGTGAVRVPAVLHADASCLLLEWLEPGATSSAAWAALGRSLARLHRTAAPEFGWHAGNFIGPLPQKNERSRDWPAFWWECRLAPQVEAARSAGLLGPADIAGFARLADRLERLLTVAGDEGPSLLHGDLWSGNVQMLAAGGVAVLDPSCYHGHREVDLAMAALFGGFAAEFEAAYGAEWPLAPGHPRRRAVYQLYYLLVHVNLFGASYVPRTRSTLQRALEG